MKVFIPSTLALLLASSSASSAAAFAMTGDTRAVPTFIRTTESGFASSQKVPYLLYNVMVNVSGAYTFGVVATGPATFDTFESLYSSPFNPTDSENNWLASNDDAGTNPDDGSELSFNLAAGTPYSFVVTGFLGGGSPDAGTFTAGISGPGTVKVTAVPEASTSIAGVMSAGLLFAFCSRRKAWRTVARG